MQKALIAVLGVAIIAGGVSLFVRRKHRTPEASHVRVERADNTADIDVVCIHCKHRFRLSEARPVPARQDTVLCPRCGKPTPRVSRGRRRKPKPVR